MRRFLLDREALRAWLREAYLHPNANWYVPVYDVRRRGLFYLTSRTLLLVDEPNMKIGRALDRVLTRFQRRDPTLRVVRQMSDENRMRLALEFIVSCEDPALRDRLLREFAANPSIVFGWRPGSLLELVPPLDEAGEESELARTYRAFLDRACDVHVDLEMIGHGLDRGPVYAVHFE